MGDPIGDPRRSSHLGRRIIGRVPRPRFPSHWSSPPDPPSVADGGRTLIHHGRGRATGPDVASGRATAIGIDAGVRTRRRVVPSPLPPPGSFREWRRCRRWGVSRRPARCPIGGFPSDHRGGRRGRSPRRRPLALPSRWPPGLLATRRRPGRRPASLGRVVSPATGHEPTGHVACWGPIAAGALWWTPAPLDSPRTLRPFGRPPAGDPRGRRSPRAAAGGGRRQEHHPPCRGPSVAATGTTPTPIPTAQGAGRRRAHRPRGHRALGW